MEYHLLKKQQPIQRGNLSNPKEKERLLKQYAGIFKNNVVEYAEKYLPRHYKRQKNHAK